jgi:hypothetical protein
VELAREAKPLRCPFCTKFMPDSGCQRSTCLEQRFDTPEQRFWRYVEKTESCWLWTAYKDRNGYGIYHMMGTTESRWVHQLAYEFSFGLIPHGLQIDHLCRNHSCVNPSHLEAVTHRENILRGGAPTAIHARQTHCVNGHEFTPENTRLFPIPVRQPVFGCLSQ